LALPLFQAQLALKDRNQNIVARGNKTPEKEDRNENGEVLAHARRSFSIGY
jgi:hypothetical protein